MTLTIEEAKEEVAGEDLIKRKGTAIKHRIVFRLTKSNKALKSSTVLSSVCIYLIRNRGLPLNQNSAKPTPMVLNLSLLYVRKFVKLNKKLTYFRKSLRLLE